MSFVEAVVKRALSQDGVREALVNGSRQNAGKEVEAYLASTGTAKGNPWCAAFVYWCISEEVKAAKIEVPFLRSAYCPSIHTDAKVRGLLRDKPERGDAVLVLRWYGSERAASHIGLVTAVLGSDVHTVEGNTNSQNSSEGDGVYQRIRALGDNLVFVRWARLVPPTKPETYQLVVNGKPVADMPVRDGRSLIALRVWAKLWGLPLVWDDEDNVPILDGLAVEGPVYLIGGLSYVPVTSVIKNTRFTLKVDVPSHRVLLTGAL